MIISAHNPAIVFSESDTFNQLCPLHTFKRGYIHTHTLVCLFKGRFNCPIRSLLSVYTRESIPVPDWDWDWESSDSLPGLEWRQDAAAEPCLSEGVRSSSKVINGCLAAQHQDSFGASLISPVHREHRNVSVSAGLPSGRLLSVIKLGRTPHPVVDLCAREPVRHPHTRERRRSMQQKPEPALSERRTARVPCFMAALHST